MIKGINVTLYEKTASGTDDFNHTEFTTRAVVVKNVLVGNGTGNEVTDQINMTGKKATWMLAIPKGDTHEWRDCDVEFKLAGTHRCHTYGAYIEGIESMMPLKWHRQIRCEEYG